MKLTQKLIGYLNRVFEKDPQKVLALRIRYEGDSMEWRVADGVLSTMVTGGPGIGFDASLAGFTVAKLAEFIAGQPGWSVVYEDHGHVASLSALVLIDGQGDQDQSNGDHLYGYTSVLWAYMEAVANELTLARAAIVEALKQMAASTASNEWVDEHGGYYRVPRLVGEEDGPYADRIVAEVIKARGNNISIADAVEAAIGQSTVIVDDFPELRTAADGTKSYGLFDVTIELPEETAMTSAQISRTVQHTLEVMRDAGTHLRRLKYLRRTTLRTYLGAVTCAGINTTVSYRPATPGEHLYATEDGRLVVTENWRFLGAVDDDRRLDGSWRLDGSKRLDGYKLGG